ncbi:HAD family hydrolase [Paraburkholderia sp. SIMBA_027]|uniref:HAD family hydrolase n=1 Tax=Paraburkholderia sp. SIMBA_027 TaxID=3085770 RepID=UPI00397C1F4B
MRESKVKESEGASRQNLVIFDCDGVLVDSEQLGLSILAKMLRKLGVDISDEVAISRFRGRRIAECLAEIEGSHGITLPSDFERRFRSEAQNSFASDLQAVDGVVDALNVIQARTCVASSAPLDKIHFTLSLTGLLARFAGRIFSAYEVQSWKPDPTLFRHAARMMDSVPARTIVIEDSIVGVMAGVAAGMTVLGYASHDRAGELLDAGASTTFSTMALLPDLISQYQSR